ncbi:hypothetical protein Dimus_034188 [Dionaea muscipula]
MSTTTTAPVLALPRFIMLKANNYDKFLRVVAGDDQAAGAGAGAGAGAAAKGYVQFTADTGVDPEAKFEVEASKEPGNRGLVHIRSCYNNRYLARASEDSTWIKAWSTGKDEADKTHWACTLFEPIRAQDDDKNGRSFIRLRHVQLGSFVSLTRTSSPVELDWGVSAAAAAAHHTNTNTNTNVDVDVQQVQQDVFRVTDWESVLILPKLIAIEGSNGKYLIPGNRVWRDYITLLFNGDDIGDATLPAEVIPIDDGSAVHIINRSNGMRWATYDQAWFQRTTGISSQPGFYHVVMSPLSDTTGVETWFTPIRLTTSSKEKDGGLVIALGNLHMGSSFLCGFDNSTSMLSANILVSNVFKPPAETRLRVVEPVVRRTISVNFRFEDAKIYGVEPIAMATKTADNRLVDTPYVTRIALRRSYTDTRSWDNSFSLKLGVETTFKSGIPLIAEAEFTVTAEVEDSYTWGESHDVENEASAEVEVTVPPMSKVTASLMALKGRCNIPFSYVQTDVYYDGRTASHTLYDGVYNGVNHYSFYSRVEPAVRMLPLSSSSADDLN